MVNHLDVLFSALSDPTRRAMIGRLGRGGLTVGQLAEPLEMSLPAVVKHLGILESAHIVTTTKVGRVRHCSLVPGALSGAGEWIARHEAFWNAGLDHLADYLTEPLGKENG